MNNQITLQQAIDMTTRFRLQAGTIINPTLTGKNVIPLSETFDRAIFDAVLSQQGCTGVRLYAGLTPELQLRAIVVGVNGKNEDMLPSSASSLDTGSNVIGEDGQPCPPICPPPSPLNP